MQIHDMIINSTTVKIRRAGGKSFEKVGSFLPDPNGVLWLHLNEGGQHNMGFKDIPQYTDALENRIKRLIVGV